LKVLNMAIDPQNRHGSHADCRSPAPGGTRMIVKALRWH
jgi:hypothetical protein